MVRWSVRASELEHTYRLQTTGLAGEMRAASRVLIAGCVPEKVLVTLRRNSVH